MGASTNGAGVVDSKSSSLERLSHVCDVCGKAYSTAQGVFTHKRVTHELKKGFVSKSQGGGQQEKLKCRYCERTFVDERSRSQHETAKHSLGTGTGDENNGDVLVRRGPAMPELYPCRPSEVAPAAGGFFSCEICGMAVPKSWNDRQHLESLCPVANLNLVCDVCGRAFTELRALGQHQL